MNSFFRKIRLKLFTKNRIGRYLLYAIGEIILVVIGILIALQINTNNQNRINAEKEQYYLKGLKGELTENYYDFGISVENLEEQREVLTALVISYTKTNSFSRIDSLETKLFELIKVADIEISNTVFNELSSTGQIALIKNDSLRSEVITIYQKMMNTHNDIDGNLKFVFYPNIFPVLTGSMDSKITRNMSTLMQERLKDDKHNLDMIQALGLEFTIIKAHMRLIGELRDEIEPVISRIEEQITEQ